MSISAEDQKKLEIVKDYSPYELRVLTYYYENGHFCNEDGEPYDRAYMKHLINMFGGNDA